MVNLPNELCAKKMFCAHLFALFVRIWARTKVIRVQQKRNKVATNTRTKAYGQFSHILEHFGTCLNLFDSHIQGSRCIVRYPGMSHVKKSHSMNSLARGMSYVNQQVGVKTEQEWQDSLEVSCQVMYSCRGL